MSEEVDSDLGNLPENWIVSDIQNETEFVTDYVANGSFASLAKNVKYKSEPDYAVLIRLTDFNNNFNGDFVYVDKNAYNFLSKSKLHGGEIIISNVGAYSGTTFYAPRLNRPMTLGPNSIMMNFKNGNEFYFYWLKSPVGKFLLNGIISGSAQPKFNKTTFRKLKVLVPPPIEQKAIASVLSSLDDKIDLLHRQNKTLEAMAETLFRQWFLEDAQDDWKEVQITDLFEVRDGTHDSPKQSVTGKPLITSKHILDGKLDIANAYLISEDDFSKINQRSKVDTGDILFSMIGTIGLIYFEQSPVINYAIKNIGLFKTSQNPDWTFYTYLWLKSFIGRQFIDEHKSGSTQEYVALGSMRSIVFQKPPIDILIEFNKLISLYFTRIKFNHIQIQTLETLRDTLLPKLMSGEVRVDYP